MPSRPRVVCASANPHKVTELADLLGEFLDLEARPDGLGDVIEDADTLTGNAMLKAQAVMEATGEAALADDTGLFVDALGGRPGVHSARYAGEVANDVANRARLLGELDASGDRARRARFVTVIVLLRPDGSRILSEGVCEGTIASGERGELGFGYDAVFVPDDGDGRTFAEMTAVEKHRLSHRARAIEALREALGPGA